MTPTRGRPRIAGAAGYAAIVAGALVARIALGPLPFANDRGLVQGATAILFAAAGAAAYRLPALGFPLRALLATGGAWLAVDEWLMVHECLKFGPLARLGPLRDAPILAYAAAALIVAAWLALRIRPSALARGHGAVAIAATAAVLLVDVGGLLHGPEAEVIEETAELLAAWGALQACGAAARDRPSATWREALAVAAWSVAWLGAATWLLKPLGCAERFL